MNNNNSLAYRTITSDSNIKCTQNNTNRQQTQNRLYRPYNEPKSEGNRSLSNFHMNCLRESISNNPTYKNLFRTIRSKRTIDTILPIKRQLRTRTKRNLSSLKSGTMQSLNTISTSQTKTGLTNCYSFRNINLNLKIIDPCSKPQSNAKPITYTLSTNYSNPKHSRNNYHPYTRAESLSVFITNVKAISREKYIETLQRDEYDNLYQTIQSKIQSTNLNIHSKASTYQLLNKYLKEYYQYEKLIEKRISKEMHINNELREKRMELANDIQQLKMQQAKLLQLFLMRYKMKLFLLCVKNDSFVIGDFPKEDLNEIASDKALLKRIENVYINNNTEAQSQQPQMMMMKLDKKRHGQIPNSKSKQNSTGNTIKGSTRISDSSQGSVRKSKNLPIFSSIEEMDEHFSNRREKIVLLMSKYNSIQQEIKKYTIEKENMLEKYYISNSNRGLIEEQESESNKLLDLKAKNAELSNYINLIVGKSMNLNRINAKIDQINALIASSSTTVSWHCGGVNDKDNEKHHQLLFLEKNIRIFMDINSEYREKNPFEYIKTKQKHKREKRMARVNMFKKQEKLNELITNNNSKNSNINMVTSKLKKESFKINRRVDYHFKPFSHHNKAERKSELAYENTIYDYLFSN